LSGMFGEFQKEFTHDIDLREEIRVIVRDLEQAARETLTIMQRIHQEDGLRNIGDICTKANDKLQSIPPLYAALKQKIPPNEYFKYHDHFRFSTQRLVFLTAFIEYLQKESLVSKESVADKLGMAPARLAGTLHLDLEDYLLGVLTLASELSRLAINCVTNGDYERPKRIAQFMNDLDGGFRLLNFKNDILRKRFDGLKYEVKKVEEVLYDLSVRGLRHGVVPVAAAAGEK